MIILRLYIRRLFRSVSIVTGEKKVTGEQQHRASDR